MVKNLEDNHEMWVKVIEAEAQASDIESERATSSGSVSVVCLDNMNSLLASDANLFSRLALVVVCLCITSRNGPTRLLCC